MAEPFIGEIRMFAGNFAPSGWAFCDGALLSISENDALFTLYGTTYGGDGETTFALPDLRGRLPVHAGTGPGLSTRQLGETGGAEEVTLTVNQLPVHTHPFLATESAGISQDPVGRALAPSGSLVDVYQEDNDDPKNMAAQAIAGTGGSQPHENMHPFLCINFIVSLFGVFPSQT
ncbi:MAG TPA: tail fiber protein [Rhodothermia bacterium]|nr:tail fiber protein [Rhodothermia bacterium]